MQFSVRMELYGKCMISVFPYMEILLLVFLVIPGTTSYLYRFEALFHGT